MPDKIHSSIQQRQGHRRNCRMTRTICISQRCLIRSLPGMGWSSDGHTINIVNVRRGWRSGCRVRNISRAGRDHTALVCKSQTLGSTAGCWCMRARISRGWSLSPLGGRSKRNTVKLAVSIKLQKVRSTRLMRPERERVVMRDMCLRNLRSTMSKGPGSSSRTDSCGATIAP